MPNNGFSRAMGAYDDTRARIRRHRADSYAQAGDYSGAERELMAYDREGAKAYGDLGERERQRRLESGIAREIGAGNFEGAQTVATKEGSLTGQTVARTARQQITEQQRLTLYQALSQGLGELEAFAANNGEGYEQWLAEGQAAAQQDPSLAPLLRDLPPQWNPRIPSVMQRRIEGMRNSLLTPQQAATLAGRESGQWQGGAGFTNAYRINPDGSVEQGGTLPVRPRAGGADGPPAPPAGYRIVER